MAHCSVLDRDHNALILNEAVINGGIYKLTRYGEDIFLDAQATTTKLCNRTQNGKICQRWDFSWPHIPNYKPIVATHNNCASPDGDEKLWCYTNDPNVRWESCHLECKVLTTTTSTKIPTKEAPTSIPTESAPTSIPTKAAPTERASTSIPTESAPTSFPTKAPPTEDELTSMTPTWSAPESVSARTKASLAEG